MSYTPTNWANGDVITTAKLNKIENGIAEVNNSNGGILIVHDNHGILDKTVQEILNAAPLVVVRWGNKKILVLLAMDG